MAAAPQDLPAPKGFFDDADAKPMAAAPQDLPAPKGFFDDIPAPQGLEANSQPEDLPMPVGLMDSPSGGFFDDVPAPKAMATDAAPLDLDGLDLAAPPNASVAEGTSPASSSPFAPGNHNPDLGLAPSLELGSSTAGDAVPSLELPESSAEIGDTDYLSIAPKENSLQLDTGYDAGISAAKATVATPKKETAAKKGKKASGGLVKHKKTLVAAAAALGLGGAAFGGFLIYKDWSSGKAAARQATAQVKRAEALILSDAPGHWNQAATKANAVLTEDPKNPSALGIVAETNYASAYSQFIGLKEKQKLGSTALETANASGLKDPHLAKATALQSLVEKRVPDAVKRLEKLAKATPSDSDTMLYLGWAYAAAHNHAKAEPAFERVLKITPNRISALYGVAQSQLEMGKYPEAKASFLKAIHESREKYKQDHVGATLGLHQLSEVDRFGEREARYLAILERSDLDKIDPRIVSRTWALAGQEALAAGRLDEAQQRFGKSLELNPANLNAFVGEAKTGLKRGNAELAKERLSRVLGLDSSHLDATLTLAEVEIADSAPGKAIQLAESILAREPKVESREILTQTYLTLGRAQEMTPDQQSAAENSYKKSQEYAADGFIAPTVSLAGLYIKQGRQPEAIKVLEPLQQQAENDTATAVTLGIALLEGGDLERAEKNLRKALEQSPGDVEATFQLGRVLFKAERQEEGIAAFNSAYNSNETREDIGLELAAAYEKMKRVQEAREMYGRLIQAEKPSINARSRAGAFFARIGNLEKAAPLGQQILAEQPNHPAGLFLTAESLLAAGKYKKARELYQDAVRLDPKPQYEHSLGLVSEKLQLLDDAIAHYRNSAAGDKTYEEPLLGEGRVRLLRAEHERGIPPLLRALEINPESSEAYFLLGKTYRAQLNHEKARDSLLEATKIDASRPEAHYLLGESFFDLEEPKKAEKAFAASIEIAAGDEKWLDDAYYQLGHVAKMNKNRSTALQAWTTFLDRNQLSSDRSRSVQREVLRLKAR